MLKQTRNAVHRRQVLGKEGFPLRLDPILTGIAGQHYVAAELCRRGWVATITLRNTRGIDVLASRPDVKRVVGIQVKTGQDKGRQWPLNAKAEKLASPTLFYVFVKLNGPKGNPTFHVVPSKVVARRIRQGHRRWLAQKGRDGRAHRDTPMRLFLDREDRFLDMWRLLDS